MLQCREVVAAKPPTEAPRRTSATPAKPTAGSTKVAGSGTVKAVATNGLAVTLVNIARPNIGIVAPRLAPHGPDLGDVGVDLAQMERRPTAPPCKANRQAGRQRRRRTRLRLARPAPSSAKLIGSGTEVGLVRSATCKLLSRTEPPVEEAFSASVIVSVLVVAVKL